MSTEHSAGYDAAQMRYFVERTRDNFEDVGAAGVEVLPSGALWFTDANGDFLIAYAPGQWITVVPQDEA